MSAADVRVFVEAPARLHFGVLDLRGGLGRWFGGIGAAAPAPTLLVSANGTARGALLVEGEDRERATDFARRFLEHHALPGEAEIRVERALPSHAGLGSGTQLALAVARALAEVHGLDTDTGGLARAVGRGCRSAVGTWTFDGGGLVVEGGRYRDGDACGPLLARLQFPAAWRCLVAVPFVGPAISGADEAAAFAELPEPSERDVHRVAHLVLMALLPALAEADLHGFGSALSEIQLITGRWFAPVQGGTFARGPSEELVRRLVELGATGVGQSSWGPTVYGIVHGEETARRTADQLRAVLGGAGGVYEGRFPSEGARVWREPLT